MPSTYQPPDPEIPGWMLEGELQFLYELGQNAELIVEIGSWMGRSTHALLTGNLECHKGGTVWAVDHFQGTDSERKSVHVSALKYNIYAEFVRNVGHFKNLSILKMASLKASELFEDHTLDAVFIDGDHEIEPVMADLNAWWPKVKPGGYLAGHDIHWASVREALRSFFGKIPKRLPEGAIWCIVKGTEQGQWGDLLETEVSTDEATGTAESA